jgi:nucleoside-diphosphate-sugar epimerase
MVARALVTGAGGFIGNHLVSFLKKKGYWVRGVDIKLPEFGKTQADEFELLDLRKWDNCLQATRNVDQVFALAADMGGMGFISQHHSQILYNNALINFHTLEASRINGVKKYLYTSSACVYPEYKQTSENVIPLREDDAYPAQPQDAYGWEKLVTEQLCGHYNDSYDMDIKIVRFHNIYGPNGTYDGGREKVPAALCRKVAKIEETDGNLEIWGDGNQTRSFCFIEDCIEGIFKIMESNYNKPLNLGTDRLVSINELANIIIKISEKEKIKLKHIKGPEGVRGRNSDNSQLRKVLNWEPSTPLEEGLKITYNWIKNEVNSVKK